MTTPRITPRGPYHRTRELPPGERATHSRIGCGPSRRAYAGPPCPPPTRSVAASSWTSTAPSSTCAASWCGVLLALSTDGRLAALPGPGGGRHRLDRRGTKSRRILDAPRRSRSAIRDGKRLSRTFDRAQSSGGSGSRARRGEAGPSSGVLGVSRRLRGVLAAVAHVAHQRGSTRPRTRRRTPCESVNPNGAVPSKARSRRRQLRGELTSTWTLQRDERSRSTTRPPIRECGRPATTTPR